MCIRDRVKESQLPTVDDEFAKDVSEFETLAAFKKDLGEKLTQRRTAEAQNDFEQALSLIHISTERNRTGRDGSLRPGLLFRGAASPGRRTE